MTVTDFGNHANLSSASNLRKQRVNEALATLGALRGVTAAAVVDKDGFVINVRRDFELDVDALGAAAQIVFGAAKRAAQHVRQGETQLVVSENGDGITILAPLASGFVLTVVADGSAMLGALRYEMKDLVPQLNQIF